MRDIKVTIEKLNEQLLELQQVKPKPKKENKEVKRLVLVDDL